MNVNSINYISSLFNSYTNNKPDDNIIEQIGNKYSNYINISAFGESLNNLYNDLKNISNSQDREKALSGARNVITSLAKNSDGLELSKLTGSLQTLKKENADAFNSFFITENELNNMNYDTKKWVTNFANLYGTGYQKNYIEETNTILKSDTENSDKLTTIDNFINAIDTMLNTKFPKEDMIKNSISTFFKGIDNYQDLTQKNNYINDFTENITKGIA